MYTYPSNDGVSTHGLAAVLGVSGLLQVTLPWALDRRCAWLAQGSAPKP
jgi:hypothetical protein